MSFRKILIAVDDGPVAAHAADVGIELAGSPGSELAFVHAIDPSMCDLIVISSHGRGGMPRALFGSVAEAVMRHATCPVLVIRARE